MTCSTRPEKRTKGAKYARNRRKAVRLEGLAQYGGKCACCGETAEEFLTIDHINGRVPGEPRLRGPAEWERLKKAGWPSDNIQILCYNCNCAKGIYGYCPVHQQQGEE